MLTLQQKRFSWVIELLKNRKFMSLKEINDEWAKSYLANYFGEKLHRLTWMNSFRQIEYLYGIAIKANKRGMYATYSIVNPEIIEENNIEKWILSCYAYKNIVEDSMNMYDEIDLDDYPSENNKFYPIRDAIKGRKKMEILYNKYDCREMKRHVVDPLFIKAYKRRLYVLCRKWNKKNQPFYFALAFDRILDLETTNETYEKPQVTVRDFFETIYGVLLPDENMKPEYIEVKAHKGQACYLRDVPMHNSQLEMKREKEFSIFRYYIYPTTDFIGDILQKGGRLEIVKPLSLRNDIIEKLKAHLRLYEPNIVFSYS